MKQTHRISITTTHRRILRVRPVPVCAPCSMCGREVETLGQSQAADVLEVSQQILAEMMAVGLIHKIPTVSGSVRICRDSRRRTSPSSAGVSARRNARSRVRR